MGCRACEGGHTAIVSLLLDRGFDINRSAPRGWAPLLIAARFGRVAVLEHLLSRKEIKIYRQADFGWTALHFASFGNRPQVIELLLQAGADPRIARTGGRTPLDEAR